MLTDDSDLDNNVEVVSDNINFCEDMIIPKKEVKCYPNNKPWVTKGLKETINKKKSALAKKDKLALKTVGNELKIQIRSSKDQFKHKLEAKFKSTNTKEAWQGLRQITGFGVKARQKQWSKHRIRSKRAQRILCPPWQIWFLTGTGKTAFRADT